MTHANRKFDGRVLNLWHDYCPVTVTVCDLTLHTVFTVKLSVLSGSQRLYLVFWKSLPYSGLHSHCRRQGDRRSRRGGHMDEHGLIVSQTVTDQLLLIRNFTCSPCGTASPPQTHGRCDSSPLGETQPGGKVLALLQCLNSTQWPMCTPDPRQLASKAPPPSLVPCLLSFFLMSELGKAQYNQVKKSLFCLEFHLVPGGLILAACRNSMQWGCMYHPTYSGGGVRGGGGWVQTPRLLGNRLADWCF